MYIQDKKYCIERNKLHWFMSGHPIFFYIVKTFYIKLEQLKKWKGNKNKPLIEKKTLSDLTLCKSLHSVKSKKKMGGATLA